MLNEKYLHYAVPCVIPNGEGGYEPCPFLLTEEQAIRYLRLDTLKIKNPAKTLEYYRGKGHLKATRISNANFYTRESLDEFLANKTNLTYERRKR